MQGDSGRAEINQQEDHLVCGGGRAMHATHHPTIPPSRYPSQHTAARASSDRRPKTHGPSATVMLGCHKSLAQKKPATRWQLSSDGVGKIKHAASPCAARVTGAGPAVHRVRVADAPLTLLAVQSDAAQRLPRATPRNRQLLASTTPDTRASILVHPPSPVSYTHLTLPTILLV